MDYEPVALQAGKVRSHSVVGQAQLFCEFVYRPISCPQKVQDSPSPALNNYASASLYVHLVKDHQTGVSQNMLTNSLSEAGWRS